MAERVAVEEAVVAALPLEDLVFARVGAGQTHGGLRGLAAGVGEAHLIDAGDALDDLAPDLVVELVRKSVEHAALGDLRDDRVEDGLGPVAEDHRPVADAPVDVGVAVDIEEVSALAAVHHDGAGADETCVAGLTPGDDLLALGEHLAGPAEVTVVNEIVVHGTLDSFKNGRARRGDPRVWGRVPGGWKEVYDYGRQQAHADDRADDADPLVGLRALVKEHEAEDHGEGAELGRGHAGNCRRSERERDGEQHDTAELQQAGADGAHAHLPGNRHAAGEQRDGERDHQRYAARDRRLREPADVAVGVTEHDAGEEDAGGERPQSAPRGLGATLERREYRAAGTEDERYADRRRDRHAEDDHHHGHVGTLQRGERRDEAEVADPQSVQQAEEGAEVEGAGERSQPGAVPLAGVRRPVDKQRDGKHDERAGREHPDHLRERTRLARHALREQVAAGVGEGRQQAGEDSQHLLSLPEPQSPVCSSRRGQQG